MITEKTKPVEEGEISFDDLANSSFSFEVDNFVPEKEEEVEIVLNDPTPEELAAEELAAKEKEGEEEEELTEEEKAAKAIADADASDAEAEAARIEAKALQTQLQEITDASLKTIASMD
jgi:hypothetical protein